LSKIKENEQIALKLQGAMETIQYLNPEVAASETTEETTEE